MHWAYYSYLVGVWWYTQLTIQEYKQYWYWTELAPSCKEWQTTFSLSMPVLWTLATILPLFFETNTHTKYTHTHTHLYIVHVGSILCSNKLLLNLNAVYLILFKIECCQTSTVLKTSESIDHYSRYDKFG